MATIYRLNTTTSDHNMTTTLMALSLLACGIIIGAIGSAQSGNLVKAYDTIFQSTPTTQAQTGTVSTSESQTAGSQSSPIVLGTVSSNPLSVQEQSQTIVSQLQPVQGVTYNVGTTVNSLQPSANNIQLAGTSLQ